MRTESVWVEIDLWAHAHDRLLVAAELEEKRSEERRTCGMEVF
jgi:hypothetical protein